MHLVPGSVTGEIAVFVNPASRANRLNPRLASDFQEILGGYGRVHAPQTLEDIDRIAQELAQEPPSVIGVHGGDGTLHKTVSALGRAFKDGVIPPIAILCGGTMNVVAASLRIREEPSTFLGRLVEAAKVGGHLATLRRRCLRIGSQLGFIFGNGLMANFLREYYDAGAYGTRRAAWLLLRAAGSALIGGPFVERLFHRFEGGVQIDGRTLETARFVGLALATVREVGLGFKLIHRADEDPERFGVIAIHAPPLSLIPDFWAVHQGRGVSPAHAYSAVASDVEITPKEARMPYTIDGDLYYADGALSISVGPPLRFVRPRSALIVPAGGDTMIEPR